MTPAIDERFFSPRLAVSIAALPGSGLEPYALRALLEALNCVVTIHWIGAPQDFMAVLDQGASAPRYLLISGHGDEDKGFYFGEYADFIDTSLLCDQFLPPASIAPVINLPDCTVIASACAAGTEEMGRAFVSSGRVRAFVGCRDYPNGTDMLVFLVNFFHGLRRMNLTDEQAWLRAMAMTDQPETWAMRFWLGDGMEVRAPHGAESD